MIEKIPTTVYNVEKITARVTETPTLEVGNIGLGALGNIGLDALNDPNQLGALLQVG